MLSRLIAHAGQPLLPHDLLTAWNLDPFLVGLVVAVIYAYREGSRGGREPAARRWTFAAGLTVVVVALVSPLDAAAVYLLSAHMVQHVLLILVAAPLLALSAPGAALLRGSPPVARRAARRLRRDAGVDAGRLRQARNPIARGLAFVGALWLWHAAALYGAAVQHEWVHALEHASFFGTALLVWSVVLGPARSRVPGGAAVIGVFVLAMQSVFLSALLTFAGTPWYEPYVRSAPAWGLDPLADQQLAGVIMWIPAGLLHAGIALALLCSWFRELDPTPEAAHGT